MIRFLPVKALSRNKKHLLFMKEIQCKLLVIQDIEFLRVDLRENIKCCARLHRSNSRDIGKRLVNKLSLLVNSAARNNILVDTLITAQCRLNDGLCRNIGTKTHGGKHFQSLDVSLCPVLGTA